jgi:hypothetical protein
MSLLLVTSVCVNWFFFKKIENLSELNETYSEWISNWRLQVFKTFSHMKMLDENQMFEKDEDVGIVFEDIKRLIDDLNDKIEESLETEE